MQLFFITSEKFVIYQQMWKLSDIETRSEAFENILKNTFTVKNNFLGPKISLNRYEVNMN